jgi:hypothetical protein
MSKNSASVDFFFVTCICLEKGGAAQHCSEISLKHLAGNFQEASVFRLSSILYVFLLLQALSSPMERREMSLAQSEDWGFSNRSHRAAEHTTFQTITINFHIFV